MKLTGPSTGDIIEVTAERMAYGGDGVARHEGLTVFIPLAAPGDRLRLRVIERKKRYARATILEILSPSSSRRTPPCRYFGECGGCQLQHLTYDAQLEAKTGFIQDALSRTGRIDWPHEIPVRRASELHYRARAQVKIESSASAGSTSLRIGFNRSGSHEVIDVEQCPVLVPELNAGLTRIRSALKSSPSKSLASEIEMASGVSGIAVEPETGDISGEVIERFIFGARYRFSATTFFQANALLLDELVAEAVKDASGELAIDLYAGVGLFTIQLARRFTRVIGVESDPQAARFALENIALNETANIEFHTARVESLLRQFVEVVEGGDMKRPDLILLDPPRSGAFEAAGSIIALAPERIVYVSCDPVTLARDLRLFIDAGYELERITALDLFPQTYHVETVVRLKMRS